MSPKLEVGECTGGAFYIGSATGGLPAGGYIGLIEKVSPDMFYYFISSTDITTKRGPFCGNISTTSATWPA
jgi:hypothetical protein